MPVENVTANRSYELPNEANDLQDDIYRIIAAFEAIDIDVANLLVALAAKAAAVHTHAAEDIAGLQTAIDALVGAAPGTLDTLNELAAALGDDPDFAATMTAALASKLNSNLYTASDVLAKLLTVDGSGSGLDADFLRGIIPSSYGLTILGIASASALFTAIKQAATTSATGVVEKATDAEVRDASADKFLSADHLTTAMARVTLTDATTVAFNWKSGFDFGLTLTASRILGNPTNSIPGTWRTILVFGNSTTDRTLTFGNQYLNELPTLTDIDSAQPYLLSIYCESAAVFLVFASKARSW